MRPEYLTLFSASGPVTVEVKFEDHAGSVAQRFMQPADINKLLNGKDGFIREMNFDDWPFEVVNYEVDPLRNRLTITVRKPQARKKEPITTATSRATNPWSETLREQTLSYLKNLDFAFTPDGQVHMKHNSDGNGYFLIENLIARRYALHRPGQVEPTVFADPESVVTAGWAMD